MAVLRYLLRGDQNVKQWIQNLRYRFQIMMQGRYGKDELTGLLSILCLILLFLSWIPVLRFLLFFAVAISLWSVSRTLSRDHHKRRQELYHYQNAAHRVHSEADLIRRRWTDRNTFRYYRCKKCKKVLRVPVKRGKLRITCRNCGHEFHKKT